MLVEFDPGTHIKKAAEQLCAAAREHGEASGSFNDIALSAGADTTPEQVVADFDQRMKAASEAYKLSPEGKKAARESEERRSAAQQVHDSLMRKLPSLNMKDDVAVLDWLCQMQDPSDHVGVIVRRDTIVEKFEGAGYVAGANCGADYKPGDRDNTFRYLVGQCLSGLKDGPAIHPIIHKFSDEWRRKFCGIANCA